MPQVIDLFCGVGGLTRGLLDAGLNVIAGFDLDQTCQYTYEHNNGVPYHLKDINNVAGDELLNLYDPNENVRILVGCAPCQPFSQMRSKYGEANAQDEKYNLLLEYGRLIRETQPDIISMENVPQIENTTVFNRFLDILNQIGYHLDYKVIYCPDYGIPQTRRRFVLVGSLLGDIRIIEPTNDRHEIHLRDFIGDLPQIAAGEVDPNDPLHRSASLSEKNIERIQNSVPGGTWRDWPVDLRCECHKKDSGKTYSSVYGRLTWEQIGPTVTTQFYNYGTGRYGHPEQNRALSLREGAILQTFPADYDFIDPNRKFVFSDIARHIGNAVPVRLGEIIGETIIRHLRLNNYIE
ncbi:MAG: DNA (cytosine-5-)-methyltransferase [Ruminococcus sp.]|nr:DNA (cytosine-5-)-methyltransferase [Ruminococcus sp.]